MGVELISVGSQAPWYTKVSPPVTRGLEGWFCFDTDISRIGLNRAPGKPDATIVGSPTVFSSYARFTGLSHYLNTGINETADMTILVVGKAANAIPAGAAATGDATTPMYCGTFFGPGTIVDGYPSTTGIGLHHNAPAVQVLTAGRSSGAGLTTSAQAQIAADVPTAWGLRVGRTGKDTLNFTENLTTNKSQANPTSTIRVPSNKTLRIGGGYMNFAAQVDISQIVIYSVALTDGEINQIATLMRKRAARLGISV